MFQISGFMFLNLKPETLNLKLNNMEPIKNITPKEIMPGITGYYAHGASLTFGYVELKEGAVVPEHKHVQEQITYILEGQLDMVIDGKPYSMKPGMYHVIGSNVLHSGVAKTAVRVIDAFSPAREDYKK
jgi:quercetin dioxygenase-like cupin family protein